MRINKFLSLCNLGSRRSVESYVLDGRIKVNGSVCRDLATNINIDKDTVHFDDKPVAPMLDKIYIALNKPKGYIVSRKDELGRKTVYKLLPKDLNCVFPVGRLDKDSEGLILLTNDGDFAQRLIHPRFELPKVYRVEISGRLNLEDLHILRNGIVIDNKKTLPAKVFIKSFKNNITTLRMVIYEGRNRQIRKMLEKLGYSVHLLRRLQIGNIKLSNLPIGMFRFLSPGELKSVKMPSTIKSKSKFKV